MFIIKDINEKRILFNNGWKIYHTHTQDCCEYNYADYSCIKDSILENMVFDSITLEPSKYGFLLNGYLINCYSEQNGYYSGDLDIYLIDKDKNVLQHINTMTELVLT